MTSMNHLVFLDSRAGEREKILSGVKRMVLQDPDPAQPGARSVAAGDGLYFLRDREDRTVRVKATVVRVLLVGASADEDLARILKELQPALQLNEEQFSRWSAKRQALLVEFGSAQKIDPIQVALDEVTDRSGWAAFEGVSRITPRQGDREHQTPGSEAEASPRLDRQEENK
jgi:hypothetical protein